MVLRSFVTFAMSALAVLGAALLAPPAAVASSCDRTIGPGQSVQRLLGDLSAGETACLRTGTYREDVHLGVRGVTLTSAPRERATIAGRVLVEAPGVTVSGLVLDGSTAPRCEPTSDCVVKSSPTIYAPRATFTGNEVFNSHRATCFLLGEHGRPADGARILGNRIHDCGRLPATNHDHGIYVVAAEAFRIAGNLIYDNADRGVQLYPDAQRGVVSRNVLDGNGSGVIFGGDESSASAGNRVELNVISHSRLRWNVEQSWEDEPGRGNVVRANCVFASDRRPVYGESGGIAPPGAGFLAFGNRIAPPLYVDRRQKDFRLRRDSGCAGRGPATPLRRASWPGR